MQLLLLENETIKDARWNPIKNLITLNGTQKSMLDGTLSKPY